MGFRNHRASSAERKLAFRAATRSERVPPTIPLYIHHEIRLQPATIAGVMKTIDLTFSEQIVYLVTVYMV